jgi:hypothetical protein
MGSPGIGPLALRPIDDGNIMAAGVAHLGERVLKAVG